MPSDKIHLGGELYMQDLSERLKAALKSGRLESHLTVERAAEKARISTRYLYRIEAGEVIPSLKIVDRIIQAYNMSADSIFNPEKPSKDSGIEDLLRELSDCDPHSLRVIKAIVEAYITAESKD